ncbi:MAG: prolipoprotein diacylglyceryl transferase [Planctomycetota bacterium]
MPTYSILYGASIVAFFWVCARQARRTGLGRRAADCLGIGYLLAMTVGAKALHDLCHGRLEITRLVDPAHYLEGGLWGGLLVYVALAAALAAVWRGRRRDVLDLAALSVPIPWMLAKSACLLGGCCYGRPSSLPWAITFPDTGGGAPAGVTLHPTQLYDVLAMAGVLVLLSRLDRERWRGTLLLWLLALYGSGRALADAFRGDIAGQLRMGPLTLTQVLCLVAALLSVLVLPIAKSGGARSPEGA